MSEIEQILQTAKSVAIVGYSAKSDRASHWISDYLEEHGFRVYRINPILESTTERPIFKSLADLPETVDVVDIFRAPEHVPDIVTRAIAHGARAVWMQPGAENEDAAAQARAAGLQAVVGACMYAEHKKRQA
ncbi:MAG: CoA-binding protein [Planctomycetes bacterium]|nr:CoA-binding protein [Planctomycetota bacterium]